jgi:predicted ATPase
MLTRLQVDGFKNLRNLDLRFGPFTCIAGPNGAGKSNIFDAIRLLSLFASQTLMDAASHVRSGDQRPFDVAELFTNELDVGFPVMTFAAEMVIPGSGIDDLGQEARASHTFLRYELAIRLDYDRNRTPVLKVEAEALSRLAKKDRTDIFPFAPASEWVDSVFHSTRNAPDFISTSEEQTDEKVVLLHQDGGSRGQPNKTVAAKMPRTVLSRSNSSESPTVFLAKREMESWVQLQLEPSALRRPDEFTDPRYLDSNGNHLPGTLHRLQQLAGDDADRVTAQVALRLSQLIDEIKELRVERDEVRRFLAIVATDWKGREYPAHALSDGTLRFLALSVMEADPETTGTICLEEPENGIHPARIPMMVNLLQDIACDVSLAVDQDNPLRQVIVNTHSPMLIRNVPSDSLVFIRSEQGFVQTFAAPGSWRCARVGTALMSLNQVLDYLEPRSLYEKPGYDTLLDHDQYLLALEHPEDYGSA